MPNSVSLKCRFYITVIVIYFASPLYNHSFEAPPPYPEQTPWRFQPRLLPGHAAPPGGALVPAGSAAPALNASMRKLPLESDSRSGSCLPSNNSFRREFLPIRAISGRREFRSRKSPRAPRKAPCLRAQIIARNTSNNLSTYILKSHISWITSATPRTFTPDLENVLIVRAPAEIPNLQLAHSSFASDPNPVCILCARGLGGRGLSGQESQQAGRREGLLAREGGEGKRPRPTPLAARGEWFAALCPLFHRGQDAREGLAAAGQ